MTYNAQFEMCAFLFLSVIAVHFFTRQRYPSRLNRFFALFIIIGLVDIASDICSAYTLEMIAELPLWVNWLVNMLLFYCQICLAPLMFLYIICMNGALTKENRNWILLSMAPFGATFVLLSLNPATGLVFYFSETLEYMHGPLFLALYGGTVFYLILGFIQILIHRKSLRRVEYYTMITFIVMIVGSIIIQYLYSSILLTGVALSLSIVMMYLTLQNPDDMLDPLTGAFNRNGFLLYINTLIKDKRRFQIAMFDLDDMSAVNSVFGIAVGDNVLREIGAYLHRIAPGSRIFRIVGDSFVVVTNTERACRRIVHTAGVRFKERWSVGGFNLNISACICYACDAYKCLNGDEMIALIEDSLAQAKQQGRGSILETDAAAVELVRRKARVEELLRRAIEQDAVEVFFQPIVRLDNGGRIAGAEALSRIRDENGVIVMPGEFIPIAERTGLIVPLGAQVFDKACRFLRDSGLNDDPAFEKMCVNLSVVECIDDLLSKKIYDVVEHYGVAPQKLCFEITETTATLSETLPERMDALCAQGYRFALDDFGTGYANYDSIMRLPFSIVKIDKSMFDSSFRDQKSGMIFFHTIKMVRALGHDVVVEGVETKEQAELLARNDVQFAQGYYFSRPVPSAEFRQLAGEGKK